MDARFRPYQDPNPRKARKSSQFRATYAKTLKDLDYELSKVGAREVVIEAGFRDDQIRLDGWPYGRAVPTHPAVRLSFRDRKGKSIAFPCDTYSTIDENLRAIALTMKSLRDVDRYGVSQQGEQYRGWTALPPAPPAGPSTMTKDGALQFIGLITGWGRDSILGSPDEAYKIAAKKLHPDMGGSHELFVRLQEAKKALGV